jgi:hypothetical protein
MHNAQDSQGCLRHPIWTVIATIVAILTLLVAIFVWFIPNRSELFAAQQSTSTQRSTPTPALTQGSSPTPAIPQLKPFYSGTYSDPGETDRMTWSTNSQDQNGNINVTLSYIFPTGQSGNVPCTGTITKNGRISLTCKDEVVSGSYRFVGSLYSDGHIEGIETPISNEDQRLFPSKDILK